MCLNLNNCMGPAMVTLPLIVQRAGWLTPALALTVVCVLSSFAATMLCEATQRIPGNGGLAARWEYVSIVRHYYGERWYAFTAVLFNTSLQASNVAAMVVSAQVVDAFFIAILGHSYAARYDVWPPRWVTPAEQHPGSGGDPFGTVWVISGGYALSMAICIPFGFLNLDENMWFQWFSLCGLLLFTTEFIGQFGYNISGASGQGSDVGFSLTPLFINDISGQLPVVGLAVFAFSYVVTIPSWLNEKKPSVDVNKAVWWPALFGWALKLAVGMMGSWAFRLTDVRGADNILNLLGSSTEPRVTRYSAYMWNVTTMIPGIPVLAIMIRYNLLNSQVCGARMSFFLGVVAPWVFVAFVYQQGWLVHFCNWAAILCQSFVNLLLPVIVYRTSLQRYPREQLSAQGEREYEARHGHAPVSAVPAWLARFVAPETLATAIIWTLGSISVGSILANCWGAIAVKGPG